MFFLKRKRAQPLLRTSTPPKGLENIKVVRCSTARRLALRVDPTRGVICLVVPKRASEKAAWRFADENREWIIEHSAKLEKPVPFVDGAILPIFGKDRILRIHAHESRVTKITMSETTLDVYTLRDDASTNIKKFLYDLALDVIEPMAKAKAESLKKKIPVIRLRDTRQRWGSCGGDGRMMFCWRLVFAPMVVVDYIVGHECAHLVHMNHSDRFWNLCDELTQDMDYGRDWLALYGDKIMMYGLQR